MDWWELVLRFATKMIRRFEDKERQGWSGFEDIPEPNYQERAIKNIRHGHYVDAANLCLLAEIARKALKEEE